jgi:pyochelin biosynthesis protein PchD
MTALPPQLAPFLPDVEHSPSADAEQWLGSGAWLNGTIGQIIEETARKHGQAEAIVDGDVRLSYAELCRRAQATAAHLNELGLKAGDRVLLQVGTGAPAVVALLGIFSAGVIPICTVPRYRLYEMSGLAALSGPSAHLIEPGSAGPEDLLALARQLRAAHADLRVTLVTGAEPVGEAVAIEPLPEAALAYSRPPLSPLDVAALQLSGGTTGIPKIIPRFHAEYLGYAQAWMRRLEIVERDVILWSLPITHNAGMLCFLLPTLMSGAKLVLKGRFEAEDFLATVEREHVTLTGSIGPIAARLLDVADAAARFDLSSLRLFVTLHRAAEIEAHLGCKALGIYGITEGLLMASPANAPAAARHGSVGFPVSSEDEVVLLAPGSTDPVAEGEIGELCFRGPSTLRSYYRNKDATAAAFTERRYFRSGDLVCSHLIDGQDFFSFEGRVKDNIDRGGEKFGTEEIELLLTAYPTILSAVVVGMPDAYLGERVCAFIIPRRESTAPSVEELRFYLLEHGLAKFKCPERVEIVDELPETSVGKLDRPALRQRIAEVLMAEQAS